MKAKKMFLGTKAQISAEKERERCIALTVTVALLIVIIIVSSFLTYSMFYSSSEEVALPEPTLTFKPINLNSELKAVIVDHLSLTAPNETFAQITATVLTNANLRLDTYRLKSSVYHRTNSFISYHLRARISSCK
jgi:hypothetical protein